MNKWIPQEAMARNALVGGLATSSAVACARSPRKRSRKPSAVCTMVTHMCMLGGNCSTLMLQCFFCKPEHKAVFQELVEKRGAYVNQRSAESIDVEHI